MVRFSFGPSLWPGQGGGLSAERLEDVEPLALASAGLVGRGVTDSSGAAMFTASSNTSPRAGLFGVASGRLGVS